MSKPIPPRLRAALGKGHAERDTWKLVTQFELLGHPVRVIRHQLGDMMADGFLEKTEVYRTEETRNEEGSMAGTHYLPRPSSRP